MVTKKQALTHRITGSPLMQCRMIGLCRIKAKKIGFKGITLVRYSDLIGRLAPFLFLGGGRQDSIPDSLSDRFDTFNTNYDS
jgi:hypothetical protein